MTVGVYGLVAGIVKLDDFGRYLAKNEAQKQKPNLIKQSIGNSILAFCPWLMKGLRFFGTLAMFLVGGGIIAHGIPVIHHAVAGGICLLAINGVKALRQ